MAFVMSLVLFTAIHAVLFIALYCTVKWKWHPGRVSSTYKMHKRAGDCEGRISAMKAKIYDSNRRFSACLLHLMNSFRLIRLIFVSIASSIRKPAFSVVHKNKDGKLYSHVITILGCSSYFIAPGNVHWQLQHLTD